jgi:hypothetical protein
VIAEILASSRNTQIWWRMPSSAVTSESGVPWAMAAIRASAGRCGIGEQHRAGLGVQRLDLAHAVVFLVGARELVLADAVAVVVGHARRSHDAGLHMLAHGQAIGVVAGCVVAQQDAGIKHRPRFSAALAYTAGE